MPKSKNYNIEKQRREQGKQVGMKTIKRMQERYKQKQENRKNKKKELKKKTEQQEDRIDFASFVLSRKFKYLKLMMASNIKTAEVEGREVHGFMERMFPDYDWLIDNDVLDRACYFAWQEYQLQPEVHNLIQNYDFSKMSAEVVFLPEKEYFDHFPEQEFDRIMIYSDQPLRKGLTWIPNYEWETSDGYKTTVKYGPCNLLNMGSPLHDLPLMVVSHAVGQSKLFFQAKTSAEDLTREKDELIRNEIFKLRDKEKNHEDTIDELKIEANGARKKYNDLKYKMLARGPEMTEEKFKRWEKNYERKSHLRTFNMKKIKKIIYWIIAIIVFVLIIIGLIYFFTPKAVPTEVIPTANLATLWIAGGG
ncbi:MAG: hypothetical protein ACFFDF_13845 [Candidatus Odinarchaeota archaeon]